MWSVPYSESPASGPYNETIAQCCAFQRLGNIPQELVNHVSSCTYLERGLYNCPYCQKEESFCWELPYTIDESDEDNTSASGTLPRLVTSDKARPLVPTSTHQNMSVNHPSNGEPDQNHLFTNQFAEFERDTFPEVYLSTEGRPSQSPTPAVADQRNKRKYNTLPETTARYSPYQHYMPAMTFELPSSNVAGHGSTHLSARTSPEAMQSNSPQLMQRALEMNLDPFQMSVPVSPGFAANPDLVRPPHASPASQLPHQQATNQSASPQHRSRALSNASTMIPSQHSPRSQLDPTGNMELRELMGAQRSGRGSSRASEASVRPGSSGPASLPEEAEKASVQCEECGRIFMGKAAWLPSNLQRHKRETHLNAPKTKCRICGKDFNRGHNLRHHMKAVHGEQP